MTRVGDEPSESFEKLLADPEILDNYGDQRESRIAELEELLKDDSVDVESVRIIARTYATQDRMRWNANREFISQGIANLTAGLFGAFPVGGSFAETSFHGIHVEVLNGCFDGIRLELIPIEPRSLLPESRVPVRPSPSPAAGSRYRGEAPKRPV